MIIRKEVLIKGNKVYSLTLLRNNNGLCSVIANTSHKKISRGAGLNIGAALSLFDKIITQKHYEHYVTEHVFNTKCPYTIEDLVLTPITTLKDKHYIHPELFKSIEIPIRAKRCVISFGVFNSNYIEIYDEQKILLQRFDNIHHIDEFIVDAYVDENNFYIVNLLCANSIDVKQLSTQDVFYWLNTLLGHYDNFNYVLPTPATSQSHRIIHIANKGKVNYDELNGAIYYGMVVNLNDKIILLNAKDTSTSKTISVGKFSLPPSLIGNIKLYDVVSYFIPPNSTNSGYLIEKCSNKTSNDCIAPYVDNIPPRGPDRTIALADQW